MTYQEQYQKLIEELTVLEEKKAELQEIFITKKSEQSERNLNYRKLDEEIDELLRKKEMMHFSKKIHKLSTFFAFITVSVPAVIIYASNIINLINKISILKTLAYNIFIALPISTISVCATFYIGKAIIKKENNKIVNSNQYKELLNEIKNKEKQKEELMTNIQKISKEVEKAVTNFNEQKNLVDIKTEEIEEFKKEVFFSVVDAPIKNEEKNKPLTKTRTK